MLPGHESSNIEQLASELWYLLHWTAACGRSGNMVAVAKQVVTPLETGG